MKKVWNVAIYARVSTDKKEQSESIPAQIQGLKKWIMEKSKNSKDDIYNIEDVYEDHGFSGSNFNRRSFIKMKEDIEHGKVNMVLTRDLSRFARNYIVAGYYLEDYFKEKGVRFVSVLDNVDTINEVDDIVPFKNILNEMYIKDCSKRTRDGLRQRMIRGSSIASKPPYGYKFETTYEGEIKSIKLVPKEDETTKVVKEIFDLYIQGYSMGKIAMYLNDKGIDPPSANVKNFNKGKSKKWNSSTIRYILTNPKYAGFMVQGRWKKVSYKIKKVKTTSKDQWIIGKEFKGIISKDTFKKVQEIINKRRNKFRHKDGNIHLFSGVLKCNECKGSMSYRTKFKGYKCTNSQKGGGICTAHSIKEEYLKKVIMNELKKRVLEIKDMEDIYALSREIIKGRNNYEKKLECLNTQLYKLDGKIQSIYNDKLNGAINDRNFTMLVTIIQQKQENIINKKNKLINVIKSDDLKEKQEKTYNYYKSFIDKILSFKDLDRFILENLVEQIIVSEDKEKKYKVVDVYYKFKNNDLEC
ncbi:putative site-specific recombinase, resolvase family [Clostridium botulinum C str. Eklund]|nr:putative site-specific recombinase, resolvase family [Clostridium botulinum C str. Eklund]NEZ49789.1 recombinase family protein [Clostridium botulinum]